MTWESVTETRLRVRYAETDQMGIVYHANFLIWFEVGRVDYCRRHGLDYHELEQQQGLFLAVSEARCRYIRPARFDEEIIVQTSLKRLRRRSLTFAYRVLRVADGAVLAEGETVHIVVNRNGRPRSLPAQFAHLLQP
ncbi:MAG: acyl-CoA thioesterase [Acidobacteria bacterium]|nr:MAG: acyl-CoA thioesterase [Acidobacteriota bacterium]